VPHDPRADARGRWLDAGLHRSDLADDPIEQFRRWHTEVTEAGVFEPAAVVVSTADESGQPSSRHVLLRGVGPEGFTFFTNYDSRKGHELAANPRASLLFPWAELSRQVIVTGTVTRADAEVSDGYFASRERGSQLSAWASHQSDAIADRATLDARFAEVEARWADRPVERPPHWGGYHVQPATLEFWQGRPSRRHDRFRYTRTADGWQIDRLQP
jgi:pyridoxamine 5'-phosphate oxidase